MTKPFSSASPSLEHVRSEPTRAQRGADDQPERIAPIRRSEEPATRTRVRARIGGNGGNFGDKPNGRDRPEKRNTTGWSTGLLLLAVCLQVHACAGDEAWQSDEELGQSEEEILSRDLVALLDQSPLLEPTEGLWAEEYYVSQARLVLDRAGRPTGDISTARQATAALEEALGEEVEVVVTSQPSGLDVEYRRLVDTAAAWLSVTTDHKMVKEAAVYTFRCINPSTREFVVKHISCATPCRASFFFDSGDAE